MKNEDVTIKIVYDKDTRKILGAQMVSRMDISMGIHMFSLAIQEGVTLIVFNCLICSFLPHFNQPLSLAILLKQLSQLNIKTANSTELAVFFFCTKKASYWRLLFN